MRAPWYIIGWRLIWIGPAIVLRVLTTVVAFCGWGPRQARDIWEYLG